jgi:hypothetical protein
MMDNQTDRRHEALDALDELENHLETTPWDVDEQEFSADMWHGQSVTLQLMYSPADESLTGGDIPDLNGEIKTILAEMETQHVEGVPKDHAIDNIAEELSIDEEAARDKIESLRLKGDVYEPQTDRLRVV